MLAFACAANASPQVHCSRDGFEGTGRDAAEVFQQLKAQIGYPFRGSGEQLCKGQAALRDARLGKVTHVEDGLTVYAVAWTDIGMVCRDGTTALEKGGTVVEQDGFRCGTRPVAPSTSVHRK